ncbi:aminopeptidase N [Chromatiales bacterium (ex Bugula neritina AB1)]|nr:aminopeptidase N [Chromatiales bacterium (ex Bugula neritina AB1)]
MRDGSAPKPIARADYTPSNFLIDTVDLQFDLADENTRVVSTLAVRRNPEAQDGGDELSLDGNELTLLSLKLDTVLLVEGADYSLAADKLQVYRMPAACVLEITTGINPKNNTALEGLYLTSGNFCTQCEAEGFRRITYYLDRPDIMARFSVRIVADQKRYPVLLSNGNEVDRGESGDGRHWVLWQDPYPKPCYLFALVAGNLSYINDTYTTASGRTVGLKIYVEQHNLDKCAYAMESLIKSMRWDEQVYGLEYDLDLYMVVAVDDFNMGAMENKGLNIFNSKYVLADQATATDTDFQGVESVIAHEYFHNWTGNRVTCRDWFQLSLKEGLTVFRDQEFSSDLNSRAVKRIDDVRLLRTRQFPEDAGPMAHAVRPDSYIEINNFYTVTIYEKGAEVIRMMHSLLGAEDFRRGMDLYFQRHDGQAVTCEDFVAAMEAASSIDLAQFRLWYSQSGTPVVSVETEYSKTTQQFTLRLKQNCPLASQQSNKPFHIPFAVALLDAQGHAMPLQMDGCDGAPIERLLDFTTSETEFCFTQVKSKPVPSLLRRFSAPVLLEFEQPDEELALLLAHDSDPFNRWEASQILATRRMERYVEDGGHQELDQAFIEAFSGVLSDPSLDAALRAETLMLPTIEAVAERHDRFEIDALAAARRWLQRSLALQLEQQLSEIVHTLIPVSTEFRVNAESIGRRSLRNRCLNYLVATRKSEWLEYAYIQFQRANNMTDQIAALNALVNARSEYTDLALVEFYDRWKEDRLVIDKWFSIQAMADTPTVIGTVKKLMSHADFDISNPNRARSLIGAFAVGNPIWFHAADGEGHRFLTDCILSLDAINPQVAARLVSPLIRWKRFDPARQASMRASLEKISQKTGLSNDVFEIVDKGLQG